MDEFQYKAKNGTAVITGYSGDSNTCMIPEILDACPVTGVGAFAFSEHRQLERIVIPESVKQIGAHAFYNCRALRQIDLYDSVEEIGDGAFKNCDQIRLVQMKRKTCHSKCLKGILSEVNQELEVDIRYSDGTAKLIFPYYLYHYEENTPARIINQVTEGSGIRYRECITGEDVNYAEYDRIFTAAMHIDVLDASWKIACFRLNTPYRLSDAAKRQYEAYLYENRMELVRQMLKQEQYQSLTQFLQMKLLTGEDLKACIETARTAAEMEGLCILLEYQRETYGTGTRRKVFEF